MRKGTYCWQRNGSSYRYELVEILVSTFCRADMCATGI